MKIKYYNLKKIIKICPQKWKCVNFLVRDVFKCRLVNFSVRVCVCVLALKWLVFLSIWFRHRQKKEMNGEGGKTRGSIFTKRAVWANLSCSDSRYDEHEPEWTWSWWPRDDEGETFFFFFFVVGGRNSIDGLFSVCMVASQDRAIWNSNRLAIRPGPMPIWIRAQERRRVY